MTQSKTPACDRAEVDFANRMAPKALWIALARQLETSLTEVQEQHRQLRLCMIQPPAPIYIEWKGTKEELEALLAAKPGPIQEMDEYDSSGPVTTTAARAMAVAAERERCAKLADQWAAARVAHGGGLALANYASALRSGVNPCD